MPCLATVAPAPVATSAAAVEKLIELALQVEAEIDRAEARSPELMGLAAKARMLVQVPLKLRTVLRYSRVPGAAFLESLFPNEQGFQLRQGVRSIVCDRA